MKRLLWLLRSAIRRWLGAAHLFDIVARAPDGRVLHALSGVPNRLFDEGEILDLRAIYRAEAVFTSAFYGRLYNRTPVDTDTLVILGPYEMSGNGYAPIPWSRGTSDWGVPSILPSGEGESLAVIKGWTASGAAIGPFTHLVLATTLDTTGKAYSFASLGGAYTIDAGVTWEVRPRARRRGTAF